MTIHSDVQQGTKRWLTLRAGIPTASKFANIVTPSGKPSESRHLYMDQLLAERILNQPLETFQSDDMARGSEFEQKAVSSYEFQKDCNTEQIGFVTNFDDKVGCSPDRFIVGHPEGALECKCPKPETHVGYLRASLGAGKKYKVQLQGQLWVCEKEWIDILSFHPDMPEALYRVYRDEEFIKQLSASVLSFARELDEISSEFTERGYIKLAAEEDATDSSFMTQEDIDWALGRFQEGRQ